jgi:hypothetical protein
MPDGPSFQHVIEVEQVRGEPLDLGTLFKASRPSHPAVGAGFL